MNEGESPKGLACFLDQERLCGPDCMAFLPEGERPTDGEYTGRQWSGCLLLVNAHRSGKHLTILASLGDKLLKRDADRQRAAQPAAPSAR